MSHVHSVHEVGPRLRQVRLLRHMSQAKLAEAAGVGPDMISHVEQGRKLLSLGAFANVCRVLECSADYLLAATPPIMVPRPLPGGLPPLGDTQAA